ALPISKKIALILIVVLTRQQTVHCLSIHHRGRLACIVARSHKLRTELQGCREEYVKLDFPVAEYIRIRRSPTLVFGEHVVYDSFLIRFAEVDGLKWNAEVLCHDHSIIAVIQPRAFLADGH